MQVEHTLILELYSSLVLAIYDNNPERVSQIIDDNLFQLKEIIGFNGHALLFLALEKYHGLYLNIISQKILQLPEHEQIFKNICSFDHYALLKRAYQEAGPESLDSLYAMAMSADPSGAFIKKLISSRAVNAILAARGDIELLKKLLSTALSIDASGSLLQEILYPEPGQICLIAIQNKHYDLVQFILDESFSIDPLIFYENICAFKMQLFFRIIEKGQVSLLNSILDKVLSLDSGAICMTHMLEYQSYKAIRLASHQGHDEIIDMLFDVAQIIDPSQQLYRNMLESNSFQSIVLAAENGHLAAVQSLLKRIWDIDRSARLLAQVMIQHYFILLSVLTDRQFIDIFNNLSALDQNSLKEVLEYKNQALFRSAVKDFRNENIAFFLLQKSIEADPSYHLFINFIAWDKLEFLILNIFNHRGEGLLDFVFQQCPPTQEHDAFQIKLITSHSFALYQFACQYCNVAVIDFLCNKALSLDTSLYEKMLLNYEAFGKAIKTGSSDVVRYIIDKAMNLQSGLDRELICSADFKALHIASQRGYNNILFLLLEHLSGSDYLIGEALRSRHYDIFVNAFIDDHYEMLGYITDLSYRVDSSGDLLSKMGQAAKEEVERMKRKRLADDSDMSEMAASSPSKRTMFDDSLLTFSAHQEPVDSQSPKARTLNRK